MELRAQTLGNSVLMFELVIRSSLGLAQVN